MLLVLSINYRFMEAEILFFVRADMPTKETSNRMLSDPFEVTDICYLFDSNGNQSLGVTAQNSKLSLFE